MKSAKYLILQAVLLLSLSGFAQGDLMITPRRVVFEGNKTSQELTLANTGSDTARYSISFIQYRMLENGNFEQIESPDSGQYFADKYLRIFPRSVVLGPGEAQVVRMQFRRMPDMQQGEYRSHLYFRSEPEEKALGEESSSDSASIGIRLVPIYGISIPVIIRVGDPGLQVRIENLSLDMQDQVNPVLSMDLLRSGGKSVYGDMTVQWVPQRGESVEVGTVRGLAVYTPNTLRRFSMQLRTPAGVDLGTGKLWITYSAPNDLKPEVYTETSFFLQ